jgi:3',5'-nucleoside bisphosphate phosphatase
MMRNVVLFFFFIGVLELGAQNVNNVPLPHMHLKHPRKEIAIPDILGYQTLKCDFHMHTIFSDGVVWPEVRVQEAWEEGLDAIAITDHIENQPSKPHVGGDHNTPYDVSIKKANEMGVILIKGGEITRSMPPGHLNAIFLSDVNALDTETPFEAIEAAIKQNAFIMWNHPGWKAQQPDTCRWWPEHEALYQKGWIHGIEVFNEKEWYPIVLDWCKEKDLAVIGNSDIHDVNAHYYDVVNGHRPMTLVFSEERSEESIKEAMFAKRTLAYFDNKLAGKEPFLKAVFEASLTVELVFTNQEKDYSTYNITNSSDITYLLEMEDDRSMALPARGTSQLRLPRDIKTQKVKVTNLLHGSDQCLVTSVVLP